LKKPNTALLLSIVAVLPVIALAVSIGTTNVSLGTVVRVLVEPFFSLSDAVVQTDRDIVMGVRLPRVLSAFFIGAGLSIIGVAMQALVRNPLADPFILGISGGASAGASLFYLGFLPPVLAVWLSMPLAAFGGALLSITLVYLIARGEDGLSVSRLLLAGVAMASLMAAITSFITYMSTDANQLRAILFWLLGSLAQNTWDTLPLIAIASLLGFAITMIISGQMDALLLGEEPAESLGVRVEIIKKVLVVLAAFVTGVMVANSGIIGFVGLIIPHMARSFAGISHRYVVPLSFVGGGIFLVLADLVARTLLPGQDLPVGIVTAITGVPFFLILLRKAHYKFS